MISKIFRVSLVLLMSGCATPDDGSTREYESALVRDESDLRSKASPDSVLVPFNLANYENLSQSNNPTRAASLAYYDHRAFVLTQDMVFNLRGGEALVVPAGFVTDYASIPEKLWSFYSPHDVYSRAAVIHDYLYWTQQCTKLQADNLFLIAMGESSVSASTRNAVYKGVVTFGKSSWCQNKQARARGLPRVLQRKYWTAPKGMSWSKYQATLFNAGLRDPATTDYAGICRYGDVQALPSTRPPIPSTPVIEITKC